MFYLTDLLGLPVYDSSGKKAGNVVELAATLGSQPPRVALILLEKFKGEARFAVPFEQVSSISTDQIGLTIPEPELKPFQPDEGLFLLRKDLLDQQIIDVHGRKVVRVNDLALEQKAVNHHVELLLQEVDIGLRGALHRLFTGAIPKPLLRKLESRVKPATIPWDYVNLIEADPMRRVKLNISHKLLTKLHPADLADIVEDLPHRDRHAILSALDDVTAAEALSEVDPKMQVHIVEAMDTARAADIVEEMSPDDAADLLADLPEETSTGLLEDMNREEAAELGELLEFSENSAGGMMTTDYVALPSSADVQTSKEHLARIPDLPEHFSVLFLIDDDGTFTGSVPLSRLIVAAAAERLVELKSDPVLSIPADAPEDEVVELFDKYNLLALPVLGPEQHLAGVITVDDVISLLRRKG